MYYGLVAEYLAEAAHIVTAPTEVHLAVASEFVAHQVVVGTYAYELETVGIKLHYHIAAYVTLALFEHGLHIAHYGIEILSLVEVVAVECRDLILPEYLPLGEGVFLKHVMSFYYHHGCGGLETYAALDTYDSVAYVHVATYGVRTGDLLHGEDGLHMIVVLFTVDADYLALVECEGERFMTVAFELGRIGLFGKSGVGMQRLFTAYRCTPNTLVYRIFGFFEVEIDTVTAAITSISGAMVPNIISKRT